MAADAQDARRAGHAVVGVGVGQQAPGCAAAAPRAASPCSQASPSATLRAVSSPVRLASDPPWVTAPAKLPGSQPIAAPSSAIMACSTAVAHGPIS